MEGGPGIRRYSIRTHHGAAASRRAGYPIPDTGNGCVCLEVAINSKTARRWTDRSCSRWRRRADRPSVCLEWKQSRGDCGDDGEFTNDVVKSSGFHFFVLHFLQPPALKCPCCDALIVTRCGIGCRSQSKSPLLS